MHHRILNKTKQKVIFHQVEVANTFYKRLKGLLGKTNIENNYALIIFPCKGIHTVFMKFPIDLIVLNNEKKVIHKYRNIEPFRMINGTNEWHYVIECHSDQSKEVEINDLLDW
jgi:uncharacterized protein